MLASHLQVPFTDTHALEKEKTERRERDTALEDKIKAEYLIGAERAVYEMMKSRKKRSYTTFSS